MKRIQTFFLFTLFSLTCIAKPEIHFIKSIPEDGAEISSFIFDLEFDLSEVYEEYGESGDIKLCLDNFVEGEVNLYKGVLSRNNLLKSIYNSELDDVTFQSQSGNTLHLSFDNLSVTDGQEYTLEIKGYVFCTEGRKEISEILDLNENPIILDFIGKSDTVGFEVLGWSTDNISEMEKMEPVNIGFNMPVRLKAGAHASLKHRKSGLNPADWDTFTTELRESDIYISEDNPSKITFDFGQICMYKGVDYVIEIKQGTIYRQDDETESLPTLTHIIPGSTVHYVEAVDFKVNKDEYGLIESFEIEFECEDPAITELRSKAGFQSAFHMVNITDIDNNFITGLTDSQSESAWPRYKFYKSYLYIEPGTELYVAAEEGDLYGLLDTLPFSSGIPGFQNKEFKFKFIMPRTDEVSGIPDVKFRETGIGKFNDFTTAIQEGYATEKLETVEIILEQYLFNGHWEWPWAKKDKNGYLYEIGETEDTLIKEFPLSSGSRGNTGYDNLLSALICPVNEVLYEGKRYRMTIPEDAVGSIHHHEDRFSYVTPNDYSFYQHSPQFDFIFEGLTQSAEAEAGTISGPSIKCHGNNIIIEGLDKNDVICIYGADGTRFRRLTNEEGTIKIHLDSGIYIFVINGSSTKILI